MRGTGVAFLSLLPSEKPRVERKEGPLEKMKLIRKEI